jgi:uncharacterized protein (TIGR02271 family)
MTTTDSTPTPPVDPADRAGSVAGRVDLVRSEEQLHVRTQSVPAGYARLEKYLVTETKTVTVEVTHEEVRLVHEPVADGGRLPNSTRPSDPASDAGRWMILSREEVVVTKRTVPMERVRLDVYSVTEQREVTAEIRKEQIEASEDRRNP